MAAGDSPQAAVREEEDKESRDTVQDSAVFSQEKEVEAEESAGATVAAEEALARVAAAATVPYWVAGAGPSWTSLLSSGPPLRH